MRERREGRGGATPRGGTPLPSSLSLFLLTILSLCPLSFALSPSPHVLLRWGGDAEGGSRFVEADPTDPAKLKGFDVEIAEMIARELGMKPEFVQITFTSLDQSAHRG